nr:tyrosine-type recombinase/integrase [Pseudovibrio ascidiaceicola]
MICRTTGRHSHATGSRGVLLAPDVFGVTNEEAVLVFRLLIKARLRPSELLGVKLEHFVLEHEVPHIRVEEHSDGVIKRKLTTKWSEREIPLVGVSLDAAKRIVTMGGVQAYHLNADRWGALINKVMVERKLKETERHTPYSLRHSFEESMLEIGVDHRLRVELMGHDYNRPKYRGQYPGTEA